MIEDKERKQALLPIANNQKQVVDASVVVAILGDLEADKNAEQVYGGAVRAGAMTEEIKNMMVGQITGAYKNSAQIGRDEAIRNASLVVYAAYAGRQGKGL